ncbi:4-amino-4-deoxy-L-arabinose transferase-like glycosyltransferase [Luteimonas cucumeris]|uniref:4-amino-4-deoxy-L-arabinose transferase-like glycosyltransferase n=1 Tax=Luteimonas cucumeris TaxID=985012 RepID=A0A562L752_9GAMM|nr:glycosyltransferase family 39 protein [Luteimonas cucumeris]TWI03479.1 4-amino-4-deoxy-L-arabinose transferase-like glycosyltransferase [Luteimonas cucumeris]
MRGRDYGQRSRDVFVALWLGVTAIKCVLAARLPLFVDEAFYWQEGQHLAAAYSDLPGLTAWLARIGVGVGGEHAWALRTPFLLLAALLPWGVARLATREFGAAIGWQAATLTLLLPLAGTLGVLALPDVPMALATVLCLDAGARLLRRVDAKAVLELASGLMLGALSHYRFAAVIGIGALVLLSLPEGRRVLRDARVWVALMIGVLAWWPLMAWNFDNADAGLRFQLVDRHPWTLHWDGLWFVLVQTLLVTPLLLVAMALAAWRGLRDRSPVVRYLASCGSGLVLGFFVLGFFADNERVSFHWPLPGYLALLPLVPAVLAGWSRGWRNATWGLLAAALATALLYYAAVSVPAVRAQAAYRKWYPANFAGWDEVAEAVRGQLAKMPPGTRLVADNFKLGAELGFALDDARIAVLDHPLNHRHGRAPQLRLWRLEEAAPRAADDAPVLLVVGAADLKYRQLLDHYHALCAQFGPLPPPTTVNIDHGAQRFLMFDLSTPARDGACTTPAMAWIDMPAPGATVGRQFDVAGWAFKDGVGIVRVEVTLDDMPVATARYGKALPHVAEFWKISTDPTHPRVGFEARINLPPGSDGLHWLGLTLHGNDGSVEQWPQQRLQVAGAGD